MEVQPAERHVAGGVDVVVGNEVRKMKEITKEVFLLIVVGTPLFLVSCSSEMVENNNLAQCLTEKGITMYGTEWCSHCQNQKATFGESFKYVNYVDCDKDRTACLAAGVEGYPTWVIDGNNYPGEQSLNRLASLSGC